MKLTGALPFASNSAVNGNAKQKGTLKKLDLELPWEQKVREAKETAERRAVDVAKLIEENKTEIEKNTESERVKLDELTKKHDKELAKREELNEIEQSAMAKRHHIEKANMTERHRKALVNITDIQGRERADAIQHHADVGSVLSARHKELKEELLELKNKQVSSVEHDL